MTDSTDRSHGLTYAGAGVDLDAREATASRFGAIARSTHGPQVIDVPGAFAGLFALGSSYRDPVLVASTDGVGTKVMLHAAYGTMRLAGHDIVHNNVNDLVTTGARPLFFLDYIATNGLSEADRLELVDGIAEACRGYGIALLGGETADMPDTYRPGDFDLAGFVVGVVERSEILGPALVEAGDALVAVPSNGLMTNGYSLAREVWALGKGLGDDHDQRALAETYEELEGHSLGEALTAAHPPFLDAIDAARDHLHAVSHITGGGIPGNLPRILRDDLAARIELDSWEVPGLFRLIEETGEIEAAEMFRAFNMGVGMVFAVPAAASDEVVAAIEGAWRIGEVEARDDGPAVRGLPGERDER